MSESAFLADRLARASIEGTWVGTPLVSTFADLSATEAAAYPIANAHSIHEIVAHVAAWYEAVQQRLLGKHAEPEGDTDWPPVTDTSESAWKATQARLHEQRAHLVTTIRTLDADALSALVPGKSFPVRAMLYGIIEHDHYHVGQIVMLRKLLRP